MAKKITKLIIGALLALGYLAAIGPGPTDYVMSTDCFDGECR